VSDTVKLAAFKAMPDQRAPLLSIKQKVDAARPLGFDKILQGPASNFEKAPPVLLVTVTNCPADFGRLVVIVGEAVNSKFTVGWTARLPESVTVIVYVAGGVAVWAIAKPPVTVPSVLIVQAWAANGVRPAGALKVQLRAIVPFANPDPEMLTKAEPAVPYPAGALVGETKTCGVPNVTTVKVALGEGATPLLGRTKTSNEGPAPATTNHPDSDPLPTLQL
jgi:hypothetical protein